MSPVTRCPGSKSQCLQRASSKIWQHYQGCSLFWLMSLGTYIHAISSISLHILLCISASFCCLYGAFCERLTNLCSFNPAALLHLSRTISCNLNNSYLRSVAFILQDQQAFVSTSIFFLCPISSAALQCVQSTCQAHIACRFTMF